MHLASWQLNGGSTKEQSNCTPTMWTRSSKLHACYTTSSWKSPPVHQVISIRILQKPCQATFSALSKISDLQETMHPRMHMLSGTLWCSILCHQLVASHGKGVPALVKQYKLCVKSTRVVIAIYLHTCVSSSKIPVANMWAIPYTVNRNSSHMWNNFTNASFHIDIYFINVHIYQTVVYFHI